jgi:hypothetical protein
MTFISLPRKIRTEIGDLLEEAQGWGEERIMTMLSYNLYSGDENG